MSDRSHDPRDVTTSPDSGHESWLESAAAYALDALDAGEREAFESHLAGCAVCRGAVQEYRDVTGLLVHASQPVDVPAGLGARVGRLISADRQGAPAGVAAGDGAQAPRVDASVTSIADRRGARAEAPGRAERAERAERKGWQPATVWLAAASVAFAAVSGVLWRQVQAQRDLVAQVSQAISGERASRDSLMENLRGTRVHVVSLAAPGGAAPVARVFWNHERNNYVVTAFGLPRAPEGRTYQLWAVVKGRDPVSMGTFNTDTSGVAMVVIPVSDVINGLGVVDLCALTEEPAGGSPGPTETPRFAGEWRHTD